MSPAQARKRRRRLAKAERLRLRDKERADALQRALLSSRLLSLREAEGRTRGRRDHWTRRLLRWLTGGCFG